MTAETLSFERRACSHTRTTHQKAWRREQQRELCGSLGDGGDQAARLAGRTMTSVPSWKVTPATTFGNWVSPLSRLQPLAAAMMSLNTISLAVVGESAPLVRTVRCRTVANTLSIGFVVRKWSQCSAGRS